MAPYHRLVAGPHPSKLPAPDHTHLPAPVPLTGAFSTPSTTCAFWVDLLGRQSPAVGRSGPPPPGGSLVRVVRARGGRLRRSCGLVCRPLHISPVGTLLHCFRPPLQCRNAHILLKFIIFCMPPPLEWFTICMVRFLARQYRQGALFCRPKVGLRGLSQRLVLRVTFHSKKISQAVHEKALGAHADAPRHYHVSCERSPTVRGLRARKSQRPRGPLDSFEKSAKNQPETQSMC